MKTRFILLTLSLLIGLGSYAQDSSTTVVGSDNEDQVRTLVSGPRSHGGFGAIHMQYGQFDGADLLLLGIRGGWVIDHGFSLGLGGVGIVPDIRLPNKIDGEDVYLYGGYGGFYLEPTIAPRFPVHVTFPILIGAGAVTYYEGQPWDAPYYEPVYEETYDVFFVVEPSVQLELNVVRFFRIGVGATYRYVHDLTLVNTASDAFSGWNGNLTLKFGKF